jgi:hypothetical protein
MDLALRHERHQEDDKRSSGEEKEEMSDMKDEVVKCPVCGANVGWTEHELKEHIKVEHGGQN